MKLGDCFRGGVATTPEVITINMVCVGAVLPGGDQNPHPSGCKVQAKVALVPVSIAAERLAIADEMEKLGPALGGRKPDRADENIAAALARLRLAIREYDDKTKVGGPFFPTVSVMRDLLLMPELDRIALLYQEYLAREQPEVIDTETFRDPEAPGPRVVQPKAG